jgi:hypothetical protein
VKDEQKKTILNIVRTDVGQWKTEPRTNCDGSNCDKPDVSLYRLLSVVVSCSDDSTHCTESRRQFLWPRQVKSNGCRGACPSSSGREETKRRGRDSSSSSPASNAWMYSLLACYWHGNNSSAVLTDMAFTATRVIVCSCVATGFLLKKAAFSPRRSLILRLHLVLLEDTADVERLMRLRRSFIVPGRISRRRFFGSCPDRRHIVYSVR